MYPGNSFVEILTPKGGSFRKWGLGEVLVPQG